MKNARGAAARVGFTRRRRGRRAKPLLSSSSRPSSRARASTAPRGEGHAAATMSATRPSWVMTHAVVRSETRGRRVRSAFRSTVARALHASPETETPSFSKRFRPRLTTARRPHHPHAGVFRRSVVHVRRREASSSRRDARLPGGHAGRGERVVASESRDVRGERRPERVPAGRRDRRGAPLRQDADRDAGARARARQFGREALRAAAGREPPRGGLRGCDPRRRRRQRKAPKRSPMPLLPLPLPPPRKRTRRSGRWCSH